MPWRYTEAGMNALRICIKLTDKYTYAALENHREAMNKAAMGRNFSCGNTCRTDCEAVSRGHGHLAIARLLVHAPLVAPGRTIRTSRVMSGVSTALNTLMSMEAQPKQ
eukprot:scaffold536_cov409-Prasinococcus_capsulatus_cf.AAC.5